MPVSIQDIALTCAVVAALMTALALYLFARLVVAQRKARMWDQVCPLPLVRRYTLVRRFGRVWLKEARP